MSDVLPGRARPGRSARDLLLPAALLAELLAGVALGVTRPWQGGEPAASPGASQPRPTPSTASPGRTPPPAPTTSAPAPRVTHTPVNPFSPG